MEKTENDNTLHTVFKMSLNRRVDITLQISKDAVLVFEQFCSKSYLFLSSCNEIIHVLSNILPFVADISIH